MSRRKNGFILFLIVLLCLLLLSQLMGDSPQFEPGGANMPEASGLVQPADDPALLEPVELSAVVFMAPEEFRLLQQWNEQYERAHPGRTVKLTNIAKSQAFQYFIEQAEAGASPDVLLLDNTWVGHFAARGLLAHAAAEAAVGEGRPALSQLEKMLTWNGYVWAVPRSVDPYVAVLNRPLLEQAGLETLPGDAEGWRAVHGELAEQGTDAGIGIDPHDPGALISAVWALGGEWVTGESGMIRVAPESGRALEALLGASSGAPPAAPILRATGTEEGGKWQGFAEDRWLAVVVRFSDWLLNGSGKGIVAASLFEEGAEGLWAEGTSFAVSSSSAHAAEAFEWISAMTEPDRLAALVPVTGALPPYPSALEAAEVRALPQWENAVEAAQSHRVPGAGPRLPEQLHVIRREMAALLLAETATLAEWNERLEARWAAGR